MPPPNFCTLIGISSHSLSAVLFLLSNFFFIFSLSLPVIPNHASTEMGLTHTFTSYYTVPLSVFVFSSSPLVFPSLLVHSQRLSRRFSLHSDLVEKKSTNFGSNITMYKVETCCLESRLI